MAATTRRAIHHEPGKHEYAFERGIPTEETVRRAYDEADLNRAIQAYKFFYPTVSGAAIIKGNMDAGIIPNKVFGILDTDPQALVFSYDHQVRVEVGSL